MDANDSETLRAALGTLRQQEAKGRGKYGTDLDGAGLTAAQLLTHATEEAADLLMYLTALKAQVATLGQPLNLKTTPVEREQWAAEWQFRVGAWWVGGPNARAILSDLETALARVAELERSLSSTETHRQALAHELSRAQQLDEASLKTIARKDRRIGELEAEVARLKDIGEDLCINMGAFIGDHECPSQEVIRRWDAATGQDNAAANVRAARAEPKPITPAFNPLDWQTAGTGSGDLRGQGLQPAPTTRPLTTADREAVRGDVVRHKIYGHLDCVGPGNFLHLSHGGAVAIPTLATMPYISRADGGPVTVEVQP